MSEKNYYRLLIINTRRGILEMLVRNARSNNEYCRFLFAFEFGEPELMISQLLCSHERRIAMEKTSGIKHIV